MQGTWVQSLDWEDFTLYGTESALYDPHRAHDTQPLSPHAAITEPVLCNKRSHCDEAQALQVERSTRSLQPGKAHGEKNTQHGQK